MRLFVGLGNPGKGYEHHRHNVGFMAMDAIAAHHHFSPWRNRFSGEIAEGTIGGTRLILLKPMTYMNASGRAVQEAVQFYKLAPGNIAVFHDELDLAPGKIRVKHGGGSGGHNGIRDISACLGTDFTRVRIGIGHPSTAKIGTGTNGNRAAQDPADYVLRNFSKEDQLWLTPLLETLPRAASFLADGAADRFMSEMARLAPPPETASDGKTSESKD